MKEYESSAPTKLPRRALALVEFAFAGLLLLLGFDAATSRPGGGCAGFAAGLLKAFAVPMLVLGLGVLLSALSAWRGTRLWWVWQTALLALFVGAPVALALLAALASAFV